MKNDETGKRQKPESVPIRIQSDLIVAAMAGMLNDWKTDSLRFGSLGERPRILPNRRRGSGPECGEH